MRRWVAIPKKKGRIEIIPMIDVMMFLLVFFVLISLNVIPALGMKTKLPTASQPESLQGPHKQVVITIASTGALVVDNQTILLDQLPDAVRRVSQGVEKVAIVINSDQGVQVQTLVDVMDQLKSNGWNTLSIAAKKR